MATKKSSGHPGRGATSAPRAGAPAPLVVSGPPEGADPKAQAEHFMAMLDAFAQQGTPEAKRIRGALIEAVSEYGANPDKAQAGAILKARLAGLEAGVCELLLRSTRKLRDRFVQEARKQGSSSKLGQTAHAAAEGFTVMVDGLEKLLQAAETGDVALRDAANEQLAAAQEKMAALS